MRVQSAISRRVYFDVPHADYAGDDLSGVVGGEVQEDQTDALLEAATYAAVAL